MSDLASMGCFLQGGSISNRSSSCSGQRGRVPLGRFLPKDTQLIKGHADTEQTCSRLSQGTACFTYRASGTFGERVPQPGLTSASRPDSGQATLSECRCRSLQAGTAPATVTVAASGVGVRFLGKGFSPCPYPCVSHGQGGGFSWFLRVLIGAVRGRPICLLCLLGASLPKVSRVPERGRSAACGCPGNRERKPPHTPPRCFFRRRDGSPGRARQRTTLWVFC